MDAHARLAASDLHPARQGRRSRSSAKPEHGFAIGKAILMREAAGDAGRCC